MPSDKVEITQKEIDDVYKIIDAPKEDAKEEPKQEKQEEGLLTEEEQLHDDKLAETLNWNEENIDDGEPK